jgi:hypothetical protein
MTRFEKAMALRASRQREDWFLVNLLSNLARSATLMHRCIRDFRSNPTLFQEAIRNYTVALVGALETFYRDLFVWAYARRPEIVSTIISSMRSSPCDISHHTLSPAEVASSLLSFQRLSEIERAITPLLDGVSYFASISNYSLICIVPSRSDKLVSIQLPMDWRSQIERLLADRHRFIHDSNAACNTEPKFMAKVEFIVVCIAHFTSAILNERIVGKRLPESSVPAFLLVEDLIAEDWIVGDDSAAG